MPFVEKTVTTKVRVFVPKALGEWSESEKIAFFDACYEYAKGNLECQQSGAGYEEGGFKDYDRYCAEKLDSLLGAGVYGE